MRAATIAALFGEGILVTLNATKLIMYWRVLRVSVQEKEENERIF